MSSTNGGGYYVDRSTLKETVYILSRTYQLFLRDYPESEARKNTLKRLKKCGEKLKEILEDSVREPSHIAYCETMMIGLQEIHKVVKDKPTDGTK